MKERRVEKIYTEINVLLLVYKGRNNLAPVFISELYRVAISRLLTFASECLSETAGCTKVLSCRHTEIELSLLLLRDRETEMNYCTILEVPTPCPRLY